MNRRSPPACRRVRAALQAWADGQRLPEGLQAHLDRCSSCRGFRDFLTAYPRALKTGLDARMRGWPPADLEALLSARPSGQVAPGAVAGTRRRRRGIWALAAAAAAALMVAGWGAYRLFDAQLIARAVRAGLSAAVDRLYAAPLAGGVEGALVHPEPDEGRLLEGMSTEPGLEGLGAGWFSD